ncbi:MAG: hypothetical protein JWQ90_4794 [Hydrocarboniphaga sp.]|uniref:hypothetical protein n=1 Tax=Hydrocarboniphaga sp. TaxID=2033016 RepID=UPI002611ABCE|nr:hypothetical protein [Hydrocarboniphaga sp.]MDB5972344.1 hypothetical protein [Hydrocarboniphaga sp.]
MSNQLTVNFPVPPDAAIPEGLQTIFLYLTIAATAGVLVWALLMARNHRSAVPVLMVAAGFAAVPLETIVTFLGHAIHPAPGQIMMFNAVDRAIPWHIALGYAAGFGMFYLSCYPKMIADSFTNAFIWKACAITAVCYSIGEAYPVSHGLWVYYDYQPLRWWSGTAPLTWNVLNTICMLMGATLMHVTLPYLKGLKQLLIVVLGPVGALMGHMGAGFPMYNAMNTDWPHWVIELSGVASVLIAILLIWICTILLTRRVAAGSAGLAAS